MERLEKGTNIDAYTAYRFTTSQSDAALNSTQIHGSFLGRVIVGTVGTSPVITIGNGPTTTPANIISKITPTQWGYVDIGAACDKGVYVAISGSGFDVTVLALDMAV